MGRRSGVRWLLLGAGLAIASCRERISLSTPAADTGRAGAYTTPEPARSDPAPGPSSTGAATGGEPALLPESTGSEAARPRDPERARTRPPTLACPLRREPTSCSLHGDSAKGVRLVGSLLEPSAVHTPGVLDLDASGEIRCVGCDCGDAEGALVIECPDLVVSPGLVNLHDHLSYAGTPPLSHPDELYQHRNEWRLGQHGHAALEFSGGASAAQVLAHELRHLMSGTTSIVGAGGRRGFLRNLELPGLGEGLLPGEILAETFPLDDSHGDVPGTSCRFGDRPISAETAATARAFIPHLGEGTNQLAQDELRCALGSLGLVGRNTAIVHALAVSREGAAELARLGASVIWSPRSNLDLYGRTAPVALLASLGVRIALGTDWLASGSMNLSRELACAKSYDHAALDDYFDDVELWRMVTENPAWALGLAGRFGALAPGLVGDVAVFRARSGDPYQTVVESTPADVELVLRGGRPLYGAADWVAAFRDGEACEELSVCGEEKRVCAGETGLSLAELRAAGEAVYPLFACGDPVHEPRCDPLGALECPVPESSCEAPARALDWDERDADGDGVPDVDDVCPKQPDARQADADDDHIGDACDDCPLSSPGVPVCPRSVAELRAPATRLAPGAAVRLGGVRVTALRTQDSKGFYVEDGDHAAYSGIFVYTASKAPGVEVGDVVDVQGYFDVFEGTDELVSPQLLARASANDAYPARLVSIGEVADGASSVEALASLLVRVEAAEVAVQNPDSPKDYDETGLVGGLRLDDLLLAELDNSYVEGTRFASLTGICGHSFGHQKLFPRSLSDLVVE